MLSSVVYGHCACFNVDLLQKLQFSKVSTVLYIFTGKLCERYFQISFFGEIEISDKS